MRFALFVASFLSAVAAGGALGPEPQSTHVSDSTGLRDERRTLISFGMPASSDTVGGNVHTTLTEHVSIEPSAETNPLKALPPGQRVLADVHHGLRASITKPFVGRRMRRESPVLQGGQLDVRMQQLAPMKQKEETPLQVSSNDDVKRSSRSTPSVHAYEPELLVRKQMDATLDVAFVETGLGINESKAKETPGPQSPRLGDCKLPESTVGYEGLETTSSCQAEDKKDCTCPQALRDDQSCAVFCATGYQVMQSDGRAEFKCDAVGAIGRLIGCELIPLLKHGFYYQLPG